MCQEPSERNCVGTKIGRCRWLDMIHFDAFKPVAVTTYRVRVSVSRDLSCGEQGARYTVDCSDLINTLLCMLIRDVWWSTSTC